MQGIMKYSAFVSTLALALGLGGTALAQEMPSESQQSPEAQGQQQPSQQQQQPSQQEPSAEQQQSSQAGVIEIEQLSAEQRKEIQQKLKEQGHYQGAVDGVIGPQTVTALREFQEQNQIEANGQLTQETVEALDLTVEKQPVSGEEPQPGQQEQQRKPEEAQQQQQQAEQPQQQQPQEQKAEQQQKPRQGMQQEKTFELSAMPKEQARELQEKLQELGYYQGPIDGQLGQATRSALQRYFRDQGQLASRGMVSESSLEHFGISTDEIQPVAGEEQEQQQKQQREQQEKQQQQREEEQKRQQEQLEQQQQQEQEKLQQQEEQLQQEQERLQQEQERQQQQLEQEQQQQQPQQPVE
ncbi:MAG: peptidoglycan-binding protein [Pseudomonadota bacterium]